jgi:hypothetical protein
VEALVILVVLVSVAAAMAVLWLLLEATGEGFRGLVGPPRSDKPFGLVPGSAPPPADSVSPPSGASVPPAPEPTFRLPAASAFPPASFPVSAVRRVPASVVAPAAREESGRETQPIVTSPAQASAPTAPAPHADWSRPTIRARPGASRDLGAASAARRTAFIVGSRAREAILGYGFANPDAAMGGPPQAGEEPAPGHTVVLMGDDVEAWVRERLYGDRLPSR